MDRVSAIEIAVETNLPGAKIASIQPLGGGMSAELFLIETSNQKLVARFPSAYMRKHFECAATYEAQILSAVHRAGVPAPQVVAIGDAEDCKFLLLEHIEGQAIANPNNPSEFIREFARTLAQIHQTDLSHCELDFLMETRATYKNDRETLNEDLREPEVLQAVLDAGDQRGTQRSLRHGDFWPGNILWQNDKISGVIDWENALLGPAIADLSISRLDIYWILGRDAMDEFTARYLEFHPIDTNSLPYWDLRASLRPMANLPEWADPYPSLGRPDMTPEHMQSVLLEFVDSGLQRISLLQQ